MKTSLIKKIILTAGVFFVITKITLTVIIFLYPQIISSASPDVNAQAIINMTNTYRREQGLSELTVNPRLTQAAVNKARDILSKQYFNHTSPEGKKFSDWIREVGYSYFYVGENLAIDFDNNYDIFQAWLQSPTHKANIIKPQYQEIGIATLTGKYDNRLSTVVVQLFGTRVATDDMTRATLPLKDVGANGRLGGIEAIISLPALERLNHWNNIVLIIIVALVLATYSPLPQKTQTKRTKPRTIR